MALTRSADLPSLADLRQRYRQQLTSAGYLVLLFGVLNFWHSSGGLVCLGLVAAVALVSWVLTYQRARAVADVATSRIGSAAQGYVELMGHASGGASELLRSPFSATECVWYRYRVYERDSDDDWCEVERGSSTATFELSDGSACGRPRRQTATINASATSWTVMLVCIDQPTARREYGSSTTAAYSQPSAIQM